jgi:hypothetical protein
MILDGFLRKISAWWERGEEEETTTGGGKERKIIKSVLVKWCVVRSIPYSYSYYAWACLPTT